ncbi:head GIN domain-containing protein [Sphingomicrobium aestuariivivum]|uniref:head GIN domain-containing protein n=1 Tax=Sphingomicrobium aestuariivivum TaxID=1582356 RepID=UPI001FD71898|nr:head GIN domain-containing protein [Sphingomicrobium aestuariivivum]MCJ8191864.1 DUF2807 domain-containing protein [Sphingomicrobium aestuariivivum]
MLTNWLKAGMASAVVLGGTMLMFQPGSAKAAEMTTGVQSSVYNGGEMVIGSGNRVRQARPVSAAVRRIVIEDASDLDLKQGAPSLTVETDDNIIDMIKTRIEGDTLYVTSKGSYRTRIGVKAMLTLPSLDAATINGSGDIDVTGWQGEALDLEINGSGDIMLAGRVEKVDAQVHGSGDIDLRGARIGRLDVEVAGSGDIRTGAPREVKAAVYGSGDVHIDGNPRIIGATVTGTGDIHGAH